MPGVASTCGAWDNVRVPHVDPDRLLEALDPDQQKVARQVSGPLAVLAGAGTGKTRAITYRMAYGAALGAYDPTSVLALTFTTKAAAEMRSRLRALGVPGIQARTFHSAALRQLQYFWNVNGGASLPPLMTRKADHVASAARRVGITYDSAQFRDLVSEIEWTQAEAIIAPMYAAKVHAMGHPVPAGLDADRFARLLDAYEQAKKDSGRMDFGDVLLWMFGLMESDEDVARQIRSQYRSFVVDEFQDVSRIQQLLLDRWLGDRHDICVVGDVAQTIYSFAGARPEFLTNFARDHPGANVVELNRDYRSTPQVVAIANQVLAHAQDTPGALHLVSQREMGPGVRFLTFDDDQAEAVAIAESVKDLEDRGVALASMAVLYRTNVQSEAFEQAFADAGIPVILRGGERFFQRQEVRKTLQLVGREALREAGEDLTQRMESILSTQGWTARAPEAGSATRERWDNLNALLDLARQRPTMTLAEFYAELRERAEAQAAPPVAGVTLSTLHAAKGLEWDAVFLPGLAEGLLPSSLSKTPQAREEERRLLYVGITRARDYLQMSWALRPQGRSKKRTRSRLLDGIWPEEPKMTVTRGPAKDPGEARARRRQETDEFFEQSDPLTLAVYTALSGWRSMQARDEKIPLYSVFPNATLRDVAMVKPKTLRQLRVLKGIGAVKLEKYGQGVLRTVREAVESEPGADGALGVDHSVDMPPDGAEVIIVEG